MRRRTIVQGDHAVATEPGIVLTTVIGSCIAVCLADPVARVGGMNHFLLGEPGREQLLERDDLQRYGIHAMEVLINAMMSHGAERARLRAHLYGGANMVAGLGNIGGLNAQFARRFLATEGIVVAHEDVGGRSARRVEFLPHEGRARCVHVARAPVQRPTRAVERQDRSGELELFR